MVANVTYCTLADSVLRRLSEKIMEKVHTRIKEMQSRMQKSVNRSDRYIQR